MNHEFCLKYITTAKLLSLCCGLLMLSACGGGGSQSTDPTIAELPIAFVKRPLPTDNGLPTGTPISSDFTDPETIHPGAHLIVKSNATVDAPEIDVTAAIIGDTGDVRDPSFSTDGTKLLFALHKVADPNAVPPITWDIYEYDLTKPLSQVPGSENPWLVISSGASDGDDIQPSFMPGNRILFVSSRATTTKAIQRDQSLLTTGNVFSPTVENANTNKHAFNIFRMDDSGAASTIQQLSFNMSDDFYPSIIRYMPGMTGRILFSRWEHSTGKNQMSLYTMNPDGTDVQILYGGHSHNTGSNNSRIQFVQPRETSSGQVMALAMPFVTPNNGTFDGGDAILINTSQYTDNTVPVVASSGLSGPAQISLSDNKVSTVPGISLGGRYSSIFPMLDGTNRAIVSYSFCYVTVVDNTTNPPTTELKYCNDTSVNLSDPNTTESPPRYGIFVIDIGSKTILPVVAPEPGIYYTDVAAAMNIGDVMLPQDQITGGNTGILDIRSVYDMDGSFSKLGSTDPNLTSLSQLADPAQSTEDKANNPNLIERPAIFLRIVKGAYLPDMDTHDVKADSYGVSRTRLMREIIGYAPIDPDGSVRVEVPANVPLSISVVDRNGRRIRFRNQNNQNVDMEHRNWLTLRPGETLSCVGCHDSNSTAPHGRIAAQPASINPGASAAEVGASQFANSIVAPTYIGETMAEARTTAGGALTLRPSVDMNFVDLWTSMVTINANFTTPPRTQEDASFFYKYSLLPMYSTMPLVAPVNGACMPPTGYWRPNCRTVINYETNIDPILSYAPRYVTDNFGNGIMVSGALDNTDVSCASCHNSTNQANAGFLDFSGMAPQQNAAWLSNYSQLLQPHDEIDANGQNVTEPGPIDPNTGLATVVNVQTVPSIVAGSAAQSDFFREFTNTAGVTTPHCTVEDVTNICRPWLTVHELKLIAEWADIGAQYYNNPNITP